MIGPTVAAGASRRRLPTPKTAVDVGSATVPTYMNTCRQHTAKAEGLSDLTCEIASSTIPGTQTAIAVFLSGGDGSAFWTDSLPGGSTLIANLVAQGIRCYAVRWPTPWYAPPSGKRWGGHRMAARVASVMKKLVADNPGSLVAVVGTSNGSSQASGWLAFYGGADVASRAVLCSAPVARVQRMCSGLAGDAAFRAESNQADLVDAAYGYASTTGPCYAGAGLAEITRYAETGLDTSDLVDPAWMTKLDRPPHFIQGATDPSNLPAALADWLYSGEVPRNEFAAEVVPGVGHTVQAAAEGVRHVLYALGDLPLVFQAAMGSFTVGTTGSTASLPRLPNPGSLLLATFEASTAPANWTTPAGWTFVTSQQVGTTARHIGLYAKVADGTETGFTIATTASANQVAQVQEVGNWTGTPTVDKTAKSSGTTGTSTGTLTTATLTGSPEFAIMVVGFGGQTNASTGWTNFLATSEDTALMAVAELTRTSGTTAVSGARGWTTSAQWGAMIVTFKNA